MGEETTAAPETLAFSLIRVKSSDIGHPTSAILTNGI
jgi:hypothetical protein